MLILMNDSSFGLGQRVGESPCKSCALIVIAILEEAKIPQTELNSSAFAKAHGGL